MNRITPAAFDLSHDLEVRESTYEWTVRLFNLLRKVLKVNIELHHSEGQIEAGDIFLFNHFARFETFIPQYLIYSQARVMSRSVAASEFFVKDDPFSSFLLNAGAVPNNLPNLLPFLAREILRGRKVVVFPEGGMVKDRRVLDGRGKYSIYSRKSLERRKHHTGAAVLGMALDLYKRAILDAHAAGHTGRLRAWAAELRLDGVDALLGAALRPTTIVPANITFYPIRVSDNLLRKGAELLNRGLSRRLSEELMIEGNILLKHTDMDVRLGDPIRPREYWRWLDQRLVRRLTPRMKDLGAAFALRAQGGSWDERLVARSMRKNVFRIRDDYMHRMYADVTVNLSHLASRLALDLLEAGRGAIARRDFHVMLYLVVKAVQRAPEVHLHRSLRDPHAYAGLLDSNGEGGDCEGLAQFTSTASSAALLEASDAHYRFLPKLREEQTFDAIRLENLVAVYANEVAPLLAVRKAVVAAIQGVGISAAALALLEFDDAALELAWDKAVFSKPRHALVNDQETASSDPSPFLLDPRSARRTGVVLVHGFLASPAEVRGFGERLAAEGFAVLGPRLKGHGTSPWDLRDRSFEDWLVSVRRAYEIMRGLRDRVVLVGFSTGGALALRLAAERPAGLAGVAAVSVPMRFCNKNMVFVPLVHRANRLVRWVSSFEGVMPFRVNDNTEHPQINYRHMPIRGLYELRRMVDNLAASLGEVEAPVLLVQGTRDPVVVPESVDLLYERLRAAPCTIVRIESDRHGILHEDIGATQQRILEFVLSRDPTGEAPEPSGPAAALNRSSPDA